MNHHQPCALSYHAQYRFGLCSCRQWSVFYAPAKDKALALWETRHMQQPREEVQHGTKSSELL